MLSVIIAVPCRVALKIDEFCLSTHLVCFSRRGVLDIVTALILLKSFVEQENAASPGHFSKTVVHITCAGAVAGANVAPCEG